MPTDNKNRTSDWVEKFPGWFAWAPDRVVTLPDGKNRTPEGVVKVLNWAVDTISGQSIIILLVMPLLEKKKINFAKLQPCLNQLNENIIAYFIIFKPLN